PRAATARLTATSVRVHRRVVSRRAASRLQAATRLATSLSPKQNRAAQRAALSSAVGDRYSGLTPAARTAGTHLSIEAFSWAPSGSGVASLPSGIVQASARTS